MAEPTSSTSGVALATGAITITGSVIGLQLDALIMGLCGGLISLMFLAAMPPLRVAGTLFTAALAGGAASPFAPALLTKYAAEIVAITGTTPPRMATALAVGVLAQWIIAAAVKRVKQQGREGQS